MLEGRRDRRSRTELAVQIEGMVPFINAPTIVLATPAEVGRFPKVLAIVAHPDLPRPGVDRHPPRIAQTIRPEFRTRIGPPNKWVVLRHRAGLRPVWVIDVD